MSNKKHTCEYVDECSFYLEFGSRQSNVWQAIFNMYCKGHSRDFCDVYLNRQKTGNFMAPNIMPNGRPVSFIYQQLP